MFGNFTYEFETQPGEIIPGHYNRDCDLCLFDRHYCHICDDAVGHGHEHV